MSQVCIIGCGPAGLYSAKCITRKIPNIKIDILEKLPAPFGLVRYGIAPDHPELKRVDIDLDRILRQPNIRLFGNVQVNFASNGKKCGSSIDILPLISTYQATIIASGATKSRMLKVEGEDTKGVISSRKIYRWYNGHPDDFLEIKNLMSELNLDRTGAVIIIGSGNVALDIARIFVKGYNRLKETEITSDALQWLKNNYVKKVYIVGRKGWCQNSFSTKVLREIVDDESALCVMRPEIYDASLNNASEEEIKCCRSIQRQKSIMTKLVSNWYEHGQKTSPIIEFVNLLSTEKIMQENGKLTGVLFSHNKLSGDPFKQYAVKADLHLNTCINADLVIVSTGCESDLNTLRELFGDCNSGNNNFPMTFPSAAKMNNAVGTLYSVGWFRTGGVGNLAQSVNDAKIVAEKIENNLKDTDPLENANMRCEDISKFLKIKKIKYTTYDDWNRIRIEEEKRGKSKCKLLEKITDVGEMLNISKSVS